MLKCEPKQASSTGSREANQGPLSLTLQNSFGSAKGPIILRRPFSLPSLLLNYEPTWLYRQTIGDPMASQGPPFWRRCSRRGAAIAIPRWLRRAVDPAARTATAELAALSIANLNNGNFPN